jgi:hypothetical protein
MKDEMTYRLWRGLLMKAAALRPVSRFGVFLPIRHKSRLLEIAGASDNIHPMAPARDILGAFSGPPLQPSPMPNVVD